MFFYTQNLPFKMIKNIFLGLFQLTDEERGLHLYLKNKCLTDSKKFHSILMYEKTRVI